MERYIDLNESSFKALQLLILSAEAVLSYTLKYSREEHPVKFIMFAPVQLLTLTDSKALKFVKLIVPILSDNAQLMCLMVDDTFLKSNVPSASQLYAVKCSRPCPSANVGHVQVEFCM